MICCNRPGVEGGPPNDWEHSGYIPAPRMSGEREKVYYSASFEDDAFVIGINERYDYFQQGEWNRNDRWKLLIDANIFRRMALWYLWRWTYGEWFGLRRWLFYKWLHWHVSRWETMKPEYPSRAVHE